MKKTLLLKIVVIVFVFLGLHSGASAQVTTSSITGVIKDAKAGLPGAGIKATHTPTGSVYATTSNNDGRFFIGNIRVGGPYKVEVTYVGFEKRTFDDVYVKLGEAFSLDVVLSDKASTLNEVVVMGNNNPILNSKRNGASTTVSRTQIEALPTITRSVNDLTRLTPQANGTSIGGGSYRANNFTVDGANFNNQFGIGSNIPANGSPISIDALEEISINVTPYDVRQSGFTGAAINAVTRSGKNNFFGNAFYTTRSDHQQGYRVEDFNIANVNQLSEKQYGVSLGGPIIKNKLFFFINAEAKKTTEPGPTKVAATPGAAFGSSSNIARPTAAFLDGVSSYLKNTYGYETGPYQGYSNESENIKLFARLDWNINNQHKFNIRYSQVESKSPNSVSSSTSGSNYSPSAINNRTSINALHFANSNYFQEANLYAGTAELNSNFGKFNNSLRVSYAHQNDPRSSGGGEFPLVDILDNGAAITTFGYEPFTYGNLRDVTTYTINDDFTFAAGRHNLTFGGQAEWSTVKNGFQRFGTGYYVFNSWDDFVTNKKPINYALTYPLTADGSQAFPSFKFFQLSAYGQDEFNVNDKLKITLGLRMELPTYPDVTEIKTHPLIEQLSFNGGQKMNTGVLPKSRLMLSPRVGFNYDVLGDRSLQIRGGSGIFTGRIPFVWIVSQSGDAGMLQFTQTYGAGDPNMPNFSPDIKANYPKTLAPAGTSIPSTFSSMSPNLKFPQQWKSSLGIDYKLPYGIVATFEGIYGNDINAVYAKNVNLVDPQQLNVAGYPDNRYIFPSANADKYINKLTSAGQVTPTATGAMSSIVMDNAKGGDYFSATFQLSKQLRDGFDFTASYTRTAAKNFGDQSGDQIINLWSLPYQGGGNSNTPELSYTSNVIPDRVVASVGYKASWIGKLTTSMNLFYQGGSIGRYSYYYTTDFNRDAQSNDLIYVPKDASEITFVNIPAGTSGYSKAYSAQEQSDIFFKFVDSDPYLKSRKGQLAERNGALAPWRNQFDFRFTQQLFNSNIGKVKNSLDFYFDIFNVGNLLNSDWGVFKINNNGLLVPQNVSALTPGGTTKPTFRMGASNGDIITVRNRTNQTITSTYYMQFGLKYSFH